MRKGDEDVIDVNLFHFKVKTSNWCVLNTTEVDILFLVPILIVSSYKELTAQLPEYIPSTRALYIFLY